MPKRITLNQIERDKDSWFSVKGVCDELGMSRQGVLKAIHLGRLEAVEFPIPLIGVTYFYVPDHAVKKYKANRPARYRKK